ncbi:hypothetical protein IW262DRAFT_1303085 [Armillaria fumosa]|nr:hypothetical protein IW262DRAFT_1303085 [Armillaria fumosa]
MSVGTYVPKAQRVANQRLSQQRTAVLDRGVEDKRPPHMRGPTPHMCGAHPTRRRSQRSVGMSLSRRQPHQAAVWDRVQERRRRASIRCPRPPPNASLKRARLKASFRLETVTRARRTSRGCRLVAGMCLEVPVMRQGGIIDVRVDFDCKDDPMDDVDSARLMLGSPFLCKTTTFPWHQDPYFQLPATLLHHSQTPDCGVYCRGTTGRHGEDHFYGPPFSGQPRRRRHLQDTLWLCCRPSLSTRSAKASCRRLAYRQGCIIDVGVDFRDKFVTGSLRATREDSIVDVDDAPPTPGSPFLCENDGTLAAPTPYLQRTATLLCDSQTLDCGVYCRGTTGRHGEDRFYGPHVHHFLAGAAVFPTWPISPNTTTTDCFKLLKTAVATTTPLEWAPVFKGFNSWAYGHVHNANDEDFVRVVTDSSPVWATVHCLECNTEVILRPRKWMNGRRDKTVRQVGDARPKGGPGPPDRWATTTSERGTNASVGRQHVRSRSRTAAWWVPFRLETPPRACRTARESQLVTATLLYDSDSLDCGVYCRGTAGRNGEDRFYGPRGHHFLAAAVSFNITDFAHHDDYGIVPASQDGRSDFYTFGMGHGRVVDHRHVRRLPEEAVVAGHTTQLPCFNSGDQVFKDLKCQAYGHAHIVNDEDLRGVVTDSDVENAVSDCTPSGQLLLSANTLLSSAVRQVQESRSYGVLRRCMTGTTTTENIRTTSKGSGDVCRRSWTSAWEGGVPVRASVEDYHKRKRYEGEHRKTARPRGDPDRGVAGGKSSARELEKANTMVERKVPEDSTSVRGPGPRCGGGFFQYEASRRRQATDGPILRREQIRGQEKRHVCSTSQTTASGGSRRNSSPGVLYRGMGVQLLPMRTLEADGDTRSMHSHTAQFQWNAMRQGAIPSGPGPQRGGADFN